MMILHTPENPDGHISPVETIKHSKSDQARINGAKSTGPTSPEGKEKTSWNTLKHGFRTHRDVIHGESLDTYNQLAAIYSKFYAPQNIVEADLVQTAISARWRARRAQMMETCTFNYVMEKSETTWACEFSSMPAAYRHTMAFHGARNNKECHLDFEGLSRWEERLVNRWRRTILALRTLRGKNQPAPSAEDILAAEAMLPDNCGNFPDAPEPVLAPPDPAPAPENQECTSNPNVLSSPVPVDTQLALYPNRPSGQEANPACPPFFDVRFIFHLMHKYENVRSVIHKAIDNEALDQSKQESS